MNKTVLITGASSGIGEGCARKFASEGARLILNSRSADKLEALAESLMYATVRQPVKHWHLYLRSGNP